MKTSRTPDKHTRTAYDYKQEKNELSHFNSLAFKYDIEDDTGIENNMMQSKMQGMD